MRAVFLENLSDLKANPILIEGEQAHHLIKVLRIRPGQNLLLLDGKGGEREGIADQVGKREVLIRAGEFKVLQRNYQIDLAIGLTKKDAFEDILKSACELGVRNIFPIFFERSQFHNEKCERHLRLLESALIQSNNRYMPLIAPEMLPTKLAEISKQYELSLLLSNRKSTDSLPRVSNASQILFVVGPEGGLTEEEENLLNFHPVNLPCPILRSKTAVSAGMGLIFAMLN